MATYTPRLNLKKPGKSEVVDIDDINGNMDVLDGMVLTGTGSPEGVVTAQPGIIYIDTDPNSGSPSWAKIIGTGDTGWYALGDQVAVSGTGSPEGNIVGRPGMVYIDTDPLTTSPSWIKISGTADTGWYPIGDRAALSGIGSPEGLVTGSPGMLYVDQDPDSVAPLWGKVSGIETNTGWRVFGTGTYVQDLKPYAYTFKYDDKTVARPDYETIFWKWDSLDPEEMPDNALPGDWGFFGGKPYFFSGGGSWKQPGISVAFTDADTSMISRFRYDSSGTYFNSSANKLERISFDAKNVVISMDSMFRSCTSLIEAVIENTGSVTSMNNMFQGCSSLVEVSLDDLSSVTSTQDMFNGCSSLTEVSLSNLSSVTNAQNMFRNCSSLVEASLDDLSSVTNMPAMFYGCSSLVEISLDDLSSVAAANAMFNGCTSLVEVSLDDLNSVTDISNMFDDCSSLKHVVLKGLGAAPMNSTGALTNLFRNTGSIETIIMEGYRGTPASGNLILTNNKIGISAMTDFFNSLGAATLSFKTINVTGNPAVSDPGWAACKAIATGKGFTILS